MMRSYGNVEHLICFVENSKIRTDIARHHSKRNSDQYFVWPHEVATMIENIEKDYAKRQLWEKAYNDAQNLKLLNFHLNKPTP